MDSRTNVALSLNRKMPGSQIFQNVENILATVDDAPTASYVLPAGDDQYATASIADHVSVEQEFPFCVLTKNKKTLKVRESSVFQYKKQHGVKKRDN